MTLAAGLVLFVTLQRLAELLWSRRNERRLRAAGGIEVGSGHYPLFVILHGAWLVALWVSASGGATVSLPLLVAFVVLQAGRLWVIVSLGRFWTTRVITIPGEPLSRRGPYRFLRHPNYLVVAGEIAVVPAALGAWGVAAGFSVLNAALIAYRIRIEDATLAERRAAGV